LKGFYLTCNFQLITPISLPFLTNNYEIKQRKANAILAKHCVFVKLWNQRSHRTYVWERRGIPPTGQAALFSSEHEDIVTLVTNTWIYFNKAN